MRDDHQGQDMPTAYFVPGPSLVEAIMKADHKTAMQILDTAIQDMMEMETLGNA